MEGSEVMPEYYLDTKTYCKSSQIDFKNDQIISITYQQMDSRTGATKGALQVLKSWESSEEDILKKFYNIFKPEEPWEFIPVGFNLPFDFNSLFMRWSEYGIANVSPLYFSSHPYIDLKHVALLCNGGTFKGCTLEKFTGQVYSGDKVMDLYAKKNFKAIEKYIKDEARCFVRWYGYLVFELPDDSLKFLKINKDIQVDISISYE